MIVQMRRKLHAAVPCRCFSYCFYSCERTLRHRTWSASVAG